MIILNQLSLQRGSRELLKNASLSIYPGHKIGVIGTNGSGKSSLFALLRGELQADAGDCQIPSHWRIAHMAQEVEASDTPAIEYVLDGDTELRKTEQSIAKWQAKEAQAHTLQGAEALAAAYAHLETLNGYTARARAQQLLSGLGFSQSQQQKAVKDFSGGWRIRLNLAQALMCPSDLLLLDEPTNHLDMDTTLWLEQWLQQYDGTLLIISHDRDFIDNVVGEVVHFETQQLRLYSGNYSSFERQKAERMAQQQQAFEKQQQRVAEIEDFVRRFRAKATKAKQAQSRLKELQRMEQLAPAHVDSPFNFSFPCADKLSSPLLTLNHADLGYQSPLLSNIELSITPDTRWGLLGANGAGKSTLIKTLAGELALLGGERVEGEHLNIGYFNQHQLEALDMQASCALHLQRANPKATDQDIRNFLGSFNFHGDRALEPIAPFSGGEKARLALALIAWEKPNLLLLDEPTNHLDLEMRHALTMALQQFEGAVVVISHDRHLLRNTVDNLLLVHDGRVDQYSGSLEDYQKWLSQMAKETTISDTDSTNGNSTSSKNKAPSKSKPAKTNVPSDSKKEQRQLAAQQRQKLKPLTQAIRRLEKTMEQAQAKLNKLETELAEPTLYEADGDKAHLQSLLQDQGKWQSTLEETEEEWLAISEELEAAQALLSSE